jgi:hypothetical protein
MSDTQPTSNDYSQLLIDVKQRIRSAQYTALKAVNQELIALYWDIGQLIVDYLRQATPTTTSRRLGQICRRTTR